MNFFFKNRYLTIWIDNVGISVGETVSFFTGSQLWLLVQSLSSRLWLLLPNTGRNKILLEYLSVGNILSTNLKNVTLAPLPHKVPYTVIIIPNSTLITKTKVHKIQLKTVSWFIPRQSSGYITMQIFAPSTKERLITAGIPLALEFVIEQNKLGYSTKQSFRQYNKKIYSDKIFVYQISLKLTFQTGF